MATKLLQKIPSAPHNHVIHRINLPIDSYKNITLQKNRNILKSFGYITGSKKLLNIHCERQTPKTEDQENRNTKATVVNGIMWLAI